MKTVWKLTAMAGAALLAVPAGAQQKTTGPVADYWVTANTISGMSGPQQGGGQGGGGGGMAGMGAGGIAGAVMGGMFGGGRRGGGGQQPQQQKKPKMLWLELGSHRVAGGAPQAEHIPPPGLEAGASLPLMAERSQGSGEQTYERPRGKVTIYWGCGERAAGPPIVIDMAKIADGQMPPGLPTLSINTQRSPSQANFPSFGRWPNQRAGVHSMPKGSLVGDHVVRGNYTPEIKFSLGPNQDFMEELKITSTDPSPGGGTRVTWNAVPRATGYFAFVMGARDEGGGGGRGGMFGGRGGGGSDADVILWTSSATAAFLGQLMDYIPPAEARRLVASRVVMAPTTTSCIVPAEVKQAVPIGMMSMVAYGDEVNFANPPKPTDPKTPWNIEWTVKVRYKATTTTILGMPSMAEMMGG